MKKYVVNFGGDNYAGIYCKISLKYVTDVY